MNLLGLMWANLFRKPVRTMLTLLSILVAFLLFCLLQAISTAFDGGLEVDGTDRLIVGSKYSQIENLPYSQKQTILSVEGVDNVTHTNWFGGTYQDPKNFFAKYPVDPLSFFDIFSELDLQPEDALERFPTELLRQTYVNHRGGSFAWKIGDVIPIMGTIYAKENGDRLWEFTLVGTFSEGGKASVFPLFLFHNEYFNEAVVSFGKDQVGSWIVKVFVMK